jgi:hypothetical protein
MAYIVMARDECNDETRPSDNEWDTAREANDELWTLRDRYPDYRTFWVEQLRDKDYYLDMYMEEW